MEKHHQFTEDNPPVLEKVFVYPDHKKNCAFPATQDKGDCKCKKWIYITPGRLRISARTRSWDAANKFGQDWVRRHHPSFQQKATVAITPQPIIECIDECIHKLTTDLNLDPGSVKKLVTVRNSVDDFVKEWNQKAKKVTESLVNIGDIKLDHLRDLAKKWDREMPKKKVHTVECDRSASCKCREVRPPMSKSEKTNRRNHLVRFFDYALDQKHMEDSGRCSIKGKMKKPIRESNPAAHLVVTGRPSRAQDKSPLSDRMYAAYLFMLEVYCANRKCNHTDPNLLSRAKTYLRFLKRVGFAATDGYICKKDRVKRDSHGWFFEIRRTKTGKPVKSRISDKFYRELMTVPSGMKPTHASYIFWSGPDHEKARGDAHNAVAESGDKIDFDKALRDAVHEQETNAYDTMQKLFRKLTDLLPRDLLYEECKKDEFDILIEPTLHCFRYTFADDFLSEGGTEAQLAIALGDTEEVAREHYVKRSSKRVAEVDAVLKKMYEKEDEREALAVKQFSDVLLQQ